MTDCVLLRLGWPDKALSPHAKGHWRPKARATRTARIEARIIALQQGAQRIPRPETARLVFAFHPPDRRKRDLHNMPATMKAAIDGIADAMGVDDNKFRCAWPEVFSDPVKGGCVLIEVTSTEDAIKQMCIPAHGVGE